MAQFTKVAKVEEIKAYKKNRRATGEWHAFYEDNTGQRHMHGTSDVREEGAREGFQRIINVAGNGAKWNPETDLVPRKDMKEVADVILAIHVAYPERPTLEELTGGENARSIQGLQGSEELDD